MKIQNEKIYHFKMVAKIRISFCEQSHMTKIKKKQNKKQKHFLKGIFNGILIKVRKHGYIHLMK